ncbi:sensor of ECF-type sigma factor [Psychroserpens algicola]|uniref:Sensor of ECF-type sigma factor n=1 Tax=Psychroserpens algicola TaxID=1719034 RepID=A0ABT0H518_9FLAO|nr:sensor of ECF-type sigma factor [Psychroserpens algicola]MCK8479466.1 sensor of ECF-type sigma factor [Psychroserpens algicola]
MKKTFITLFFIALTLSAFGQKKERQERIKALKIAFITEKLELTKAEAQKFWPIYNAYEDETDMLRHNAREKRRGLKMESLSETEAKQALQDFLAFEKEQLNLKTDLVESLLTAIPAKKIILLKIVEEQFKKQMLEEFQKRREKFKNKG